MGAAILIALLIAVLSTADRFAGADVALPGRAALDPERLAKHIRKGHLPSRATSRNAALDSMLAAASAIDGHLIVPNGVTLLDEFASSIYFERLPSESDGIIPSESIESNPLLACVGCAGLSATDEALSEFPFRQWSRHDAATGFGFGPVRGGGDGAGGTAGGGGSSSAGGGGVNGGAISGLNPQPPAGGSGGDGSPGTGGSPSNQPGDSDGPDQSNNSGPNGNGSSNENTSSNEGESGSGDGENYDISSTPPGGENPPRTVVAVPEPATAALLLLGVGGTAFLRRREGRT
jgi:hypothetical protein